MFLRCNFIVVKIFGSNVCNMAKTGHKGFNRFSNSGVSDPQSFYEDPTPAKHFNRYLSGVLKT